MNRFLPALIFMVGRSSPEAVRTTGRGVDYWCLRRLMAAAILGFTRAMGEFGATILIDGNIPGQTQTLASAIYSAQQAGNERLAFHLLCVALTVGFVAVFASEWLASRREGGLRWLCHARQ